MRTRSFNARSLTAICLLGAATALSPAQTDDDAGSETPWPHAVRRGDTSILIYQPQLDSWEGDTLKGRAVVSVLQGKDDSTPTFGTIRIEVRTLVDKQQRLVTMDEFRISGSEFPSVNPEIAGTWVRLIMSDAATRKKTISLDRLEANLEIVAAGQSIQGTPVRNVPPQILFATWPALLIYIDGKPVYRPMGRTSYERVINTRPLLVRKNAMHYLRVFDGWMMSQSLEGPWSFSAQPPADLAAVQKEAIDSRQVDLLTGQSDPQQPGPSLAKGSVPKIYVAAGPTELIVTDGEPQWKPIENTRLTYVENTTGHVFRLTSDQRIYVLISGRWFRASTPTGPWEFVPATRLERDFANIPDASPKENVKASVSGTPQAREAVIAATIPETAAVTKSAAKLSPPAIDGEPRLASIAGTSLKYVVNSATPIIVVDSKTYYAVENGVWFDAPSLRGPWVVATRVPAVIYTIPPASPLHYVTYVKIYNVVGDTIYVGYTPGYHGECIDPVSRVVVYGTGYYYTPWVGTVWYGSPVTYGFGVAMRYTPWTGWAIGFGFGWSWGATTAAVAWGWGAYPWWGPYGWGWSWGPAMYPIYPVPYWGGAATGQRGGAIAWGPGGWVGTSGNIYRRWGNVANVSRASGAVDAWTGNAWAGRAGMSYNSRTGALAAGQRGAVANVYTGDSASGARGAAVNARTGIGGATRQGTIGLAATGREISGGESVFYNRNTGEVTHASHMSGGQGSVINIDGNLYAGSDGGVYKHTDNGWQQLVKGERGGERWQRSNLDTRSTQRLDREFDARNLGAQRYEFNHGATGMMHRSGSFRAR